MYYYQLIGVISIFSVIIEDTSLMFYINIVKKV